MGERHWLLEQSLVVGFAAFDFLDFDNLPSQYRPLRGYWELTSLALSIESFRSMASMVPMGFSEDMLIKKLISLLDNERCCFWELVEAD